MGHKTHPLGFRVGITQEHHSQWYTKLNKYSKLIQEDFIIRKIVSEFIQKINISQHKNEVKVNVGQIFIQRNKILRTKKSPLKDEIKLDIYSPTPQEIVGKKGEGVEKLDKNLKQSLPKQIILIHIIKIENPYTQASFIADRFVEALEARVPFRRAMKNITDTVLKELKKNPQKIGIKLQVAGRLNGAEIARTEWRREGRVPLQTLRAEIDYSSKTAATIYGSLGVKIWLFKGEKF